VVELEATEAVVRDHEAGNDADPVARPDVRPHGLGIHRGIPPE
jgi:hypothetical protein